MGKEAKLTARKSPGACQPLGKRVGNAGQWKSEYGQNANLCALDLSPTPKDRAEGSSWSLSTGPPMPSYGGPGAPPQQEGRGPRATLGRDCEDLSRTRRNDGPRVGNVDRG